MASPAEQLSPPAGEAPGTGPALEPGGAPAGAPEGTPAPHDGLPQTLPDGVQVAGRDSGQPPAPVQTPAQPAATSPAPVEPVTPAAEAPKPGERPEISSLPTWAQDLIKETRGEVARTRVEAKKAAAEEAATIATQKVTQDIGKALGLITDDTPPEQQLTPEELQNLLAGERTSTKMARTELAVFKAASGGTFNASALLDSRSFLDSVKDLDPSNTEAVTAAIAAAVEANPWLKAPGSTPPPATAPAQPVAVPATVPAAPVPPSGGSFAGGPGGQPQDLTGMSIDDFRKLRRDTPRS